ncbi:MAG: DUF3817 domain-containing protein [Cytophagaceae bacterium]|jgi:integral membrane protein|nr:DUF3817 domain-containing protein [Cytophagaceae bacterium]
MKESVLNLFRKVAFVEGISYLLIFLAGYPGRLLGYPQVMRVIGMGHGILFIAFCVLLALVWKTNNWSFTKVVFAFLLSLVPFGTFYMEHRMRKNTW